MAPRNRYPSAGLNGENESSYVSPYSHQANLAASPYASLAAPQPTNSANDSDYPVQNMRPMPPLGTTSAMPNATQSQSGFDPHLGFKQFLQERISETDKTLAAHAQAKRQLDSTAPAPDTSAVGTETNSVISSTGRKAASPARKKRVVEDKQKFPYGKPVLIAQHSGGDGSGIPNWNAKNIPVKDKGPKSLPPWLERRWYEKPGASIEEMKELAMSEAHKNANPAENDEAEAAVLAEIAKSEQKELKKPPSKRSKKGSAAAKKT